MKIILLIVLSIFLRAPIFAETNIEFTVMHGPGGVSDITSRHIAAKLGPNYIVTNRPGGAGRIALKHLIEEKTIMLATMVQVYVTNPINFKDLGYDPFRDFKIVTVVGVMPSALICNKKTGITTFDDFLQTNKKLTFGIGGYGSSEHLSTATFFLKTDSKHILISYPQGGNKSISDVIGGHIDCMFANFPTIKPHLKNENLSLIMTSHNVGYDVTIWNNYYKEEFPFQSYLSLIVPSDMPAEQLNIIRHDLTRIVTPDLGNQLKELGLSPLLIIDEDKINEIENYMQYIENFIISNGIKTTNR